MVRGASYASNNTEAGSRKLYSCYAHSYCTRDESISTGLMFARDL
jgi:hypothetical protein